MTNRPQVGLSPFRREPQRNGVFALTTVLLLWRFKKLRGTCTAGPDCLSTVASLIVATHHLLLGYFMKWITRERPKIDRIACPWLIVNFIDKDAEFLYVPREEVQRELRHGMIVYDALYAWCHGDARI